MSESTSIAGVIFDLDGTLVDSGLDFEGMRREMGLPPGTPILEALDGLDSDEARRCEAILDRHERLGVARARLMPGVAAVMAALEIRRIRRAVLTRNSRRAAMATLERFGLVFDPVVAREDAPPKPDPTAIWDICKRWEVEPKQVVMIGDYRFDIEAGRRAGSRTVLYTRGRDASEIPYREAADYCLGCFSEAAGLLEWLGGSTGLGPAGGTC